MKALNPRNKVDAPMRESLSYAHSILKCLAIISRKGEAASWLGGTTFYHGERKVRRPVNNNKKLK